MEPLREGSCYVCVVQVHWLTGGGSNSLMKCSNASNRLREEGEVFFVNTRQSQHQRHTKSGQKYKKFMNTHIQDLSSQHMKAGPAYQTSGNPRQQWNDKERVEKTSRENSKKQFLFLKGRRLLPRVDIDVNKWFKTFFKKQCSHNMFATGEYH